MPIAKVNGININYKVGGQGDPLVMIMGFGSDQSVWKYQVPELKKYYQIITFDNRGVGKSDKPAGPYSPLGMAADTVHLMDSLNIKKAHIMGVSMGGLIAQEIAINFPDRVMKLILGCTWACQDNAANGATTTMLEALKLPAPLLTSKLLDTCMDKPFNRWFLLPLMKWQCRHMHETEVQGIMGQVGCITDYDSLNRLSSIKARTLVISGTKDRVIKSGSSDTIARNIPDAKLVKVTNGSHICFLETSRVFNQEVLDFLKS